MRVLVVGAGVTGLTCAVVAAEHGHHVDVLARDLPRETVSAVGAAGWFPDSTDPAARTRAWARRTYEVLAALAAQEDAGVSVRRSVELRVDSVPEPWWAEVVPSLERRAVVPDGFRTGWGFDGLVIDMPTYLAHLVRRLVATGGTVTRTALRSLPPGADIVVNASGLGSRLLSADPTTTPVRGQVVRLPALEGVEEAMLAHGEDDVTYVVPRGDDVIVGATADAGVWDLAPRQADTAAILARAARLVPQVASAPVLGARVGLRPARPQVRLEREERPGASPVIHCYGHGDAGVTLSWGCAEEVVALLDAR